MKESFQFERILNNKNIERIKNFHCQSENFITYKKDTMFAIPKDEKVEQRESFDDIAFKHEMLQKILWKII